MKADLSRVTFRPNRHYSRVLQQQGRPILDADWNEQVSILSHQMRLLAGDLTGGATTRAGAPVNEAGFEVVEISGKKDDFRIAAGRYYVDGLCCECDEATTFLDQPLWGDGKIENAGISLVYLDAWESVVTCVDDPALLEPALSGVETCVRTRVNWRVGTHRLSEHHEPKTPDHAALRAECDEVETRWRTRSRGLLRIRLAEPLPEAGRRRDPRAGRFRGPENLLYRIEVHKGGPAGEATFKWSRENGSTLLPLTSLEGGVAVVAPLARRTAADLEPESWVEVCDRRSRALFLATPMVQIKGSSQGPGHLALTPPPDSRFDFKPGARTDVALRVWNQRSSPENRAGETAGPDGLLIEEGDRDAHWVNIEDGIQIQFLAGEGHAHHYQPGDYWLIPARTANEGMLLGGPEPRPPDGVDHYYAPLALFVPQSAAVIADYRLSFQPLAALQDQVNALSGLLDDLADRVAILEGGGK
jgi:hypothetical protein